MRFANPEWLWLLGAVPVLILGYAWRAGWRRRVSLTLGDAGRVAALAGSVSSGRRLVRIALMLGAVACLFGAMARPQGGQRSTLAPAVGIDIAVALDFSKSMLAKDAYPTRIERAKLELDRLIDSLEGDRVGLVAFAGVTMAYPLTTDYAAAKIFWRDLQPDDMPVGGTAIGKAITAASRLLKGVRGKGPPRSQVIILLTDGEDHESDPVAAAKEAAKLGIRIYAVGIGSRSGEVIPEVDREGKLKGYLSKDGEPVTTQLDEALLRRIAELTGGEYIPMVASQFGVEPIVAQLEKLQRAEGKDRLVRHYEDVPEWLLAPALLLLLAHALIGERRSSTRGRRF